MDDAPLIYCDQDMAEPEVHAFLGGRVGFYSARCPGKTTANEDAAAIVPFDAETGVVLVADGMGGHAAGEVAAQCAIREMTAAIRQARDEGALLRTGIINGFERANQAVQELGTDSGTTLAAVELGGGVARPYHAGDSIILVVGSRGKVKLQTTSHSPVGFGVEAGFLDAREAMRHEDRHLVLNAVGSSSMRIEIGSAVRLAKRDTVLLASDGLTDNLEISDVVERVRKGPFQAALGALVAEARRRMSGDTDHASKPDDLTLVAFRGY